MQVSKNTLLIMARGGDYTAKQAYNWLTYCEGRRVVSIRGRLRLLSA